MIWNVKFVHPHSIKNISNCNFEGILDTVIMQWTYQKRICEPCIGTLFQNVRSTVLRNVTVKFRVNKGNPFSDIWLITISPFEIYFTCCFGCLRKCRILNSKINHELKTQIFHSWLLWIRKSKPTNEWE